MPKWAIVEPAAAQPAPAGDGLTTGTLALPIPAPVDPNKVILTPLATAARILGRIEGQIFVVEAELTELYEGRTQILTLEKNLGRLYQAREQALIEMLKLD